MYAKLARNAVLLSTLCALGAPAAAAATPYAQNGSVAWAGGRTTTSGLSAIALLGEEVWTSGGADDFHFCKTQPLDPSSPGIDGSCADANPDEAILEPLRATGPVAVAPDRLWIPAVDGIWRFDWAAGAALSNPQKVHGVAAAGAALAPDGRLWVLHANGAVDRLTFGPDVDGVPPPPFVEACVSAAGEGRGLVFHGDDLYLAAGYEGLRRVADATHLDCDAGPVASAQLLGGVLLDVAGVASSRDPAAPGPDDLLFAIDQASGLGSVVYAVHPDGRLGLLATGGLAGGSPKVFGLARAIAWDHAAQQVLLGEGGGPIGAKHVWRIGVTPIPAITAPADGAVVTSPLGVSGTVGAGVTAVTLLEAIGEVVPFASTVLPPGFDLTVLAAEGPHVYAVAGVVDPLHDGYALPSVPSVAVALTVAAEGPAAPVLDALPPLVRNELVVTGTAVPGGAVVVSVDGSPIEPTVAEPDGTFAVGFPFPLDGSGDGLHTITATVTVDGVTSGPSAPQTIRNDATPPPFAVTFPASGVLLESLAPGGVVVVSGTGEEGARIDVEVGGTGPLVTTVVGGTWSKSITLPAGVPTMVGVSSTDAMGNEAAPTILNLTYAPRLAAPAIALSSPSRADAVPVTVSGPAGCTAHLKVNMSLQPGGAPIVGGTVALTLAGLTEGSHGIRAICIDQYGQEGALSAETTLVVDRTPPALAVAEPAEGAAFTVSDAPGGTLTARGTSDAAEVRVSLDGGAPVSVVPADGSWSRAFTVAPGAHSLSVTALDAAGNQAGPIARAFTYDGVLGAPIVLVASPTRLDPVLFTGTAAAGATVTLVVDGVAVPVTAVAGAGGAFAIELAGVAEGSHDVRAVASAGGAESQQGPLVAFLVDRTAPAAPVVTGPPLAPPPEPGAFTLTGTSARDADVVVSAAGQQVTAVVDPDSTWRASFVLPEGETAFTLHAVDAAGNRSSEVALTVTTALADDPPPVVELPTGGGAGGGCASGPGGAGSLLAVGAALLALRRRRE